VKLILGRYSDELWCDVVPLESCDILLSRSWKCQRKAVYDKRRNIYKFVKDGKSIKLMPLTPKEILEEKVL